MSRLRCFHVWLLEYSQCRQQTIISQTTQSVRRSEMYERVRRSETQSAKKNSRGRFYNTFSERSATLFHFYFFTQLSAIVFWNMWRVGGLAGNNWFICMQPGWRCLMYFHFVFVNFCMFSSHMIIEWAGTISLPHIQDWYHNLLPISVPTWDWYCSLGFLLKLIPVL